MGKKLIAISIIMAGFLFFNSCGKSQPGDVIQWKYSTGLPAEGGGASDWIKQYIEIVKEKTNGRLVITPYWSETLGKFPEEWNMVRKGICDINYITVGSHVAEFPLASVGDVPFVMPSDRSIPFLNQFFDKYFRKDFKEVHVLFPIWMEGMDFYTKKKPLKTVADMKGLQMAVPPALNFVKAIQAAGGKPVDIPPNELYGALERGMIDGGMGGSTILYAQKVYEQIKYFTYGEINCGFGVVCVNQDSWNKLPDDLKKIVEDLNESQQQKFEDIFQDVFKTCEETFRKAGIEVMRFSPEEKAKYVAATKAIGDNWEKDMIKKGLTDVTELRKDLMNHGAGK